MDENIRNFVTISQAHLYHLIDDMMNNKNDKGVSAEKLAKVRDFSNDINPILTALTSINNLK